MLKSPAESDVAVAAASTEMFDEPSRRRQAILATLIFLAVYGPFSIFQYFAFNWQQSMELMNFETAMCSVRLNFVNVIAALLYLVGTWWTDRRHPDGASRLFLPLTIITLTVITLIWLIHLHYAGSTSSVILAYVLFTFLIVSWFLPWRYSLGYLVLGNAAIVAMVMMEYSGLLPYAPLSNRNDVMAEIFMDWRVVTVVLLILGAMTVIVGVSVSRFRGALLAKNTQLARLNAQLTQEIARHRETMAKKELAIDQLEAALKDVRTLEGLLPICSVCKRIRDDSGYWNQLEGYLASHSRAQFTHGICPTCTERYYPELMDDPDPERKAEPLPKGVLHARACGCGEKDPSGETD